MRAKRTDGNQTDIVETLRKCGVSVSITSALGNGFPDIVCGYRGANYLFEIKDPAQPPSKRRLTPDEEEWHQAWRGRVYVIHSAHEAMEYMGVTKQ